jgi:hypothetical protein
MQEVFLGDIDTHQIQYSITPLNTVISVAKSNKISFKIYMSQETQLIITCFNGFNLMGRGLDLFNIGKSPVISVCEENSITTMMAMTTTMMTMTMMMMMMMCGFLLDDVKTLVILH